jgi:hypothetical protein
MRTTLGTLVTMAIVATAVGTGSTASALDEGSTLRCEATIAKSESRLFRCLALRQERADKQGVGGLGYDPSRYDQRCDKRYQYAVSGLRCTGSSAASITASDVVGVDAQTLHCRETAAGLEWRLLRCLADCADQVEFAARRGLAIDSEVCVDACADDDAAAAARAEARSGCRLGEVVE